MAGKLKFGLFGLHRGANTMPEILARRARAAEAAGFESIWVGDHIVPPDLSGPSLDAFIADAGATLIGRV